MAAACCGALERFTSTATIGARVWLGVASGLGLTTHLRNICPPQIFWVIVLGHCLEFSERTDVRGVSCVVEDLSGSPIIDFVVRHYRMNSSFVTKAGAALVCRGMVRSTIYAF